MKFGVDVAIWDVTGQECGEFEDCAGAILVVEVEMECRGGLFSD